MTIVNMHEAKTHFSQLINQALKGDEVIIAKSGVPIIKLTPYEKPKTVRKGGQQKGMMIITDNFDDPLPETYLKSFYGEDYR